MIARLIAPLFVIGLLAACGPKEQSASAGGAPAAAGAPASAPAKESPFPEWLTVAQQKGGGMVQYHPASIVRNPADQTADIWVQVIYGEPQIYVSEDKIAVSKITYQRERFLYRFDCTKPRYHIEERRIMSAGETVVETIKTPMKSSVEFMDIPDGGVSTVTYNPGCKALIARP
jgi:hypothetical protein